MAKKQQATHNYKKQIAALNRLVADLRYDRHTDMAALIERIEVVEQYVESVRKFLRARG